MLNKTQLGQPYDITLNTNKTLTGATDIKILYRKPNGETGELSGSDATSAISASMDAAENDQVGQWAFQTSAVYSGDTSPTKGEVCLIKVLGEFEQ